MMPINLAIAIVSCAAVLTAILLVLFVYCVCRRGRTRCKAPSWQCRRVPSIVPNLHLRGYTLLQTVQPPEEEEEEEEDASGDHSAPLDCIPEDGRVPDTPAPRRPKPWSARDRLEQPKGFDKRSLSLRYQEGKVAELVLSVVYKEGALTLTVREISRIHPSINKSTAYVRVKNHREKKLSIPSMLYSKESGTLLGRHQYRFVMPLETLVNASFTFYLWSTDCHSREKEFGECVVQFSEAENRDFSAGFIAKYDFTLYDTEPRAGEPSVRLMLKYHNRSARMIVSVLNISDLRPTKTMGFVPHVWVKLTFHKTDSGKQKRDKTKKVHDLNPTFDAKFNCEVTIQELENLVVTLEICAKHFQKEVVSVLEFGANSTGRLGEHWRQMVHQIHMGQEVVMSHRISQDVGRPRVNPIRRLTNFNLP